MIDYKFIIYIVVLFFSFNLTYAQKELKTFELDFKIKSYSDTFSIVDQKDNSIHFFFLDKKKMAHFHLNENYEVLSKKVYPKPLSPFKSIEGYSISLDHTVNLYFANPPKNQFLMFSINPKNIMRTRTFEIPSKKFKLISTFSHEGKFHILSSLKNSSTIRRFSFDKDKLEEGAYDFTGGKFYSTNNNVIPLSYLFKNYENSLIEVSLPSSLESASRKIKIYPKKDTVTFSLNHRVNATRVLKLVLNNNSSSISHYPIKTFNFNRDEILKSNSFINSGKIFQLITSRERMNFIVLNEITRNTIKEYTILESEPIPFKNSPIYFEGGPFDSGARQLSKTKQFLRKIAKTGNVAITGNQKGDRINIKMGGATILTGGGLGMPMSGMPIATIGANGNITFSANIMINTYHGYESTSSVYLKSVFNSETLEHVESGPFENLFDKIEKYENSIYDLHLETLFKHRNTFVYGHYNEEKNVYKLIKFSN